MFELLVNKSKQQDIRFGPPYAVVNISKLGLRYFRLCINASAASREKLLTHFMDHPNIGWIFYAQGWFNLAIGIWARDNAEINDISMAIRNVLSNEDEIVYQSELTSLYGFGDHPNNPGNKPMAIVDAVYTAIDLSPVELDYIKILTMDSSLSVQQMSELLGIASDEVEKLKKKLIDFGVIVGYQERIDYSGFYYKVFVDTLSKKEPQAMETLMDELWKDPRCLYIERANGKYDLEFELLLEQKSDIKKYLKTFSDCKIALLTNNLYTNLYPLNKTANFKEIQETLIKQNGSTIDFRNSKLWYLNYQGATSYLHIYDDARYAAAMRHGEVALFDQIVSYLQQKYPETNFTIVDIGSGDGHKAKIFVDKLRRVKAYYPVDIQPVELAAALHAHSTGTYAKHPTLLNIENLSARFPLVLHPHEAQLYLFFGGTYGNFSSAHINSYLRPVCIDSASLLIAMPIISSNTKDEDLLASYATHEVDGMAFGPLGQAGFDRNDFEKTNSGLQVHPCMEDQRVVTTFILKNDVSVLGRRFATGTTFKMTSSWKPTLEQFRQALEGDFTIEKIFENGEMALALVRAR